MENFKIRLLPLSWPIAVAVLFWFSNLNSVFSQGIPQVLTMNSGLQYEGELSSVAAIIEGTSAYSTADAQNILRIDDGLREVFVSRHRSVGSGDSNRNEIQIPVFQRPYSGSDGHGSIIGFGPFNEQGHRELVIRVVGVAQPLVYVQGITRITPRWCEVQILAGANERPMQWKMKIATGTVPTSVLRSLLRTQIGDPENPSEHLKIAEFFLQAQQFDQAIEELRLIQKKFPDLDERIKDNRVLIRQAFARQILREVRLRLDAGQTELALSLARAFNKEDLAGEILAGFNDLESQVAQSNQRLDETRKKINLLINETNNLDEKQNAAVKRLRDELETDLNAVNVPRLDGYLRLANDATMPAQQKLALAISGWLLGSNEAIDNLAIAQEMFAVRDLVQKYLTSDDQLSRKQILTQLAEFESGTPQYVTPLIRQMKPIAPPDLSMYTGQHPIEFNVQVPGPLIDPQPYKFRCLVHLPPAYDPYRRYPLLVTLPGGSQSVEQHLEMWCGPYDPKLQVRVGHAARNGYIVMAIDWRTVGQSEYQYTGREHATVMKAVRDALRKFSVDSDRVFLSGHGLGGEAAIDIGTSHPEHWAGVINVSGKMAKYSKLYRKNEHRALPVYSVLGSKDYQTITANNDAWNNWLPSKQYLDCTVVMYQGRGNELFPEDISESFKWMTAQRRRWPDKSGFSFECRVLRPWDCYFWFVEFHGIPADNIIWPEDWRDKGIPRLFLEGSYKPESINAFRIGPPSAKVINDATLWLSPEFVNFDELITIKGLGNDFKGYVKPSTEVLLEDVRRRADREHPYWARIDLTGYDWVSK